MKRAPFAALLPVVLLLLGGCGGPSAATPAPTPTPEATPSPTPEATPVPEAAWTEQVFSHEFTAKDGAAVMTVRFVLPAVSNRFDAPAYEAVDSWYAAEGAALLQDSAEAAGWAEDDYLSSAAAGGEFVPYSYVQEFEITRRTVDYISVLRTHTMQTGGSLATTFLFTDLFDLRTGERLTLAQCLGLSGEEAGERVLKEVLALNAAGAYGGAPFSEGQMKNGFDPSLFYFNDEGLVVPFQAYALGVRSVYIPDRAIPYSALQDVLAIW